ncbi:hypothetical protein JOS77_14895 [Chromobacterium haemolyticum]|nr:hypothetical protein JOS77_14895 [Chromobacterium haemolyticum]
MASMAYQADVRRWVQLSALGADPQADTLFLAGKGRGDAALLASGLEARIARPSLIYGPQGASSRLLLQTGAAAAVAAARRRQPTGAAGRARRRDRRSGEASRGR